MPARPDSQLKLDRARKHYDDFVAEVKRFYESEPWHVEHEHDGNDLVLRLRVLKDVPPELYLILGDLLHNLRSSLDCAVMELASLGLGACERPPTSTEERRLTFPVTNSAEQYDKAEKVLSEFLPEDSLATIRLFQPWRLAELVAEENGREHDPEFLMDLMAGYEIRRIHALNNLDKHRRLSFTIWALHTVGFRGESGIALESEFDPPQEEGELVDMPEDFEFPPDPPDHADFYFNFGHLGDGVEIGRFYPK